MHFLSAHRPLHFVSSIERLRRRQCIFHQAKYITSSISQVPLHHQMKRTVPRCPLEKKKKEKMYAFT